MRKVLCCFLMSVFTVAAQAASGSGVVYVGGTISTPVAGSSGTLDYSSPDQLQFRSPAGTVSIPWQKIDSWSCSSATAHHIGVLPAIAVGLVRKRQRIHYFSVKWQTDSGIEQAVLLEVPKDLPRTLHVVMSARAPGRQRPGDIGNPE